MVTIALFDPIIKWWKRDDRFILIDRVVIYLEKDKRFEF